MHVILTTVTVQYAHYFHFDTSYWNDAVATWIKVKTLFLLQRIHVVFAVCCYVSSSLCLVFAKKSGDPKSCLSFLQTLHLPLTFLFRPSPLSDCKWAMVFSAFHSKNSAKKGWHCGNCCKYFISHLLEEHCVDALDIKLWRYITYQIYSNVKSACSFRGQRLYYYISPFFFIVTRRWFFPKPSPHCLSKAKQRLLQPSLLCTHTCGNH